MGEAGDGEVDLVEVGGIKKWEEMSNECIRQMWVCRQCKCFQARSIDSESKDYGYVRIADKCVLKAKESALEVKSGRRGLGRQGDDLDGASTIATE